MTGTRIFMMQPFAAALLPYPGKYKVHLCCGHSVVCDYSVKETFFQMRECPECSREYAERIDQGK